MRTRIPVRFLIVWALLAVPMVVMNVPPNALNFDNAARQVLIAAIFSAVTGCLFDRTWRTTPTVTDRPFDHP